MLLSMGLIIMEFPDCLIWMFELVDMSYTNPVEPFLASQRCLVPFCSLAECVRYTVKPLN